MIKIVALIIYLIVEGDNHYPTLKVESTRYNTPKQCMEAGNARLEVLKADPRIFDFLMHACIPSAEIEA